jgi:hypothetical protein
MKKSARHLIAEVLRGHFRTEMTIGIDLGDAWSHYCTLKEEGEVVDRGRLRTTPKAVETWFTDLAPIRVAMEAGTHSIWISEGYITEKRFPWAVPPWDSRPLGVLLMKDRFTVLRTGETSVPWMPFVQIKK